MDLIPWRWKRKKEESHEVERPKTELARLRSEMDRVFDLFWSAPWGALERPLSELDGWCPSLDVKETEKDVEVRAEIPGVNPKDINVTLVENVLTLEGVKRTESERKVEGSVMRECAYGRFRRSIPLRAEVEPEQVEAEHKNGVVTIRLRKARVTPAKRIPVKAG